MASRNIPRNQREMEEIVGQSVVEHIEYLEGFLDYLGDYEAGLRNYHLSHPRSHDDFPHCKCFHPYVPGMVSEMVKMSVNYYLDVIRMANESLEDCPDEFCERIRDLGRLLNDFLFNSYIGKLMDLANSDGGMLIVLTDSEDESSEDSNSE